MSLIDLIGFFVLGATMGTVWPTPCYLHWQFWVIAVTCTFMAGYYKLVYKRS